MICDKLENADLYAALGPEFAQALDLLRSSQIINGADGKYSLEGSRIWCLIQRYKTKPVNS
jgi:beta-galactosidase beta subunit